MKIPLKDIVLASKCTRYYNFIQASTLPRPPRKLEIARSIIKRCYILATETGFKADWRRIVGWVDSLVFKNVDVTDEREFADAKQESEHVLKFVRSWYDGTYIPENGSSYTGLPISGRADRHLIHSVIPIVKLIEEPTIVLISNMDATPSELYNDIQIRGMQWMLSEALEHSTIAVEHMKMGNRGGNETTMSYCTTHTSAKEAISQVADLIARKVNFPSVTDMCNSCAFRRRCKL